MKRILALSLTLFLLFSLSACGVIPTPSTDPADGTTPTSQSTAAFVNPFHTGQLPLVDEPVTLTVYIVGSESTLTPEETWQFQFLEQAVGIDIDLQYGYTSTKEEYLSQAFQNGTLPDIIIGAGLTPAQLMQYGAEDGLLLDIAPYLNEEYAPNILAVAQEDPNWLQALTNADGQIFSLSGWTQKDPYNNASIFRMFYNYDVMASAGVAQCPETLDEFLQMLRAIKQEYPEMYPFGGNYERYNATYLIQNALGFCINLTNPSQDQVSHETEIGLYNGEVTLFSYDKTLLPAYLEFMHTLYTEELMDPDYYTVDKSTVRNYLKAGKYAVFTEVPGLNGGAEFGQQWWGGVPLTSQLTDTPFWPNSRQYTTGGYCIRATTEYPELCVTLADLFFCSDDIGRLMNSTPSVNDTDYLFGRTGWHYDTEKEMRVHEDSYWDMSYSAPYVEIYRLWSSTNFSVSFLSHQVDENGKSVRTSLEMEISDVNESAAVRREIPGFNEDYLVQYTYALHNTFGKYETSLRAPEDLYFEAETAQTVAELKNVLDAYASDAIRAFITGETKLNEENLTQYFNRMYALGAETYVQFYADYWAAING